MKTQDQPLPVFSKWLYNIYTVFVAHPDPVSVFRVHCQRPIPLRMRVTHLPLSPRKQCGPRLKSHTLQYPVWPSLQMMINLLWVSVLNSDISFCSAFLHLTNKSFIGHYISHHMIPCSMYDLFV